MERFICCQKGAQFEKIKDGFRCSDCGKIFLNKSIYYMEENIKFEEIKYQSKFKGRKADYIKKENTHIFSTLQTGKVGVMKVDQEYNVLSQKIFKVKKNVLEHKLNMNDTFLTITDKGVIDVYNIESNEIISEIKLGIEYNHYKIKISSFGKEGSWLYVDTEKIVIYSNDFKTSQMVLMLKDFIECEKAMSISSIDYNLEYDCFVIHVLYWKKEKDDNFIKRASVVVNNNGMYDYEKFFYGSSFELTYNFKNRIYYGIYHNKMIMMTCNSEIIELCELPVVKSYTDGGGIFWVEEFLNSPEKLYFLSNTVIVLLYAHELIVLNIERKKIEYAIDAKSNIIQSFIILDENTISFSAGLNTYIIKVGMLNEELEKTKK